jgi:hypothetical protein
MLQTIVEGSGVVVPRGYGLPRYHLAGSTTLAGIVIPTSCPKLEHSRDSH